MVQYFRQRLLLSGVTVGAVSFKFLSEGVRNEPTSSLVELAYNSSIHAPLSSLKALRQLKVLPDDIYSRLRPRSGNLPGEDSNPVL